ncbi:MAG TPA: site-specific integrase, partial [Verrucomicrobiae bacterium]|nr:site-specific integrase [Verrucomicrobiae bacterium]
MNFRRAKMTAAGVKMVSASQAELTAAKAGAAGSAAKEQKDKWVKKFEAHLASDRGASIYTQRNYAQALAEFAKWLREERQQTPDWAALQRDDFRGYVRFLGRHNLGRAAIQLRFSALRTFYKFLIRNNVVAGSPIKNLSLPKLEKRLPKFLTAKQMVELLAAPLKPLEAGRKKGAGRPVSEVACHRDVAILETIYSCGLRISELCGLNAEDVDI